MTTHPKREYTPVEIILRVLTALDIASGDSDPNIDPDMTDDEVRSEYPVVWSMQQLTSLASQLAAQKREDVPESRTYTPEEVDAIFRRTYGCDMPDLKIKPDQDREVSP